MTDTSVEVEFLGGCYNRLPNTELSKLLHACLNEAPQDSWTDEEKQYASELNLTKKEAHNRLLALHDLPRDMQLHEGVLPITSIDNFGSSDVGDVQHIVPGASFSTASFNLGAPGHSWQMSACSGHSIGMKGMIYAAKTIALFGLKMIENPDILKAAQDEFAKAMGGKSYICPIPPELPVP